MEDRVRRLEEAFDYMVETQRMMADNLVKLTEMERKQNEKIKSNEDRFEILLEEARADRAKMDRYFEETDRKLEQQRLELEQQRLQLEQQRLQHEQRMEQQRLELEQQRLQHEQRMEQLREETDRKLEQQRLQHEEKMQQLRANQK